MKTILFRVPIMVLLLGVLFFQTWSPVDAEEMTCSEHRPVSVDIKPGSYPNSIQLGSQGVVPIAVLTSSTFDANLFTPEMAHLNDATTAMDTSCGGAMATRWARDDVNRDGRPDLVFFFRTQELDLTSTSTAARLMAHGSYGPAILHITGVDTVKIRP
jgi:hypothetical protein